MILESYWELLYSVESSSSFFFFSSVFSKKNWKGVRKNVKSPFMNVALSSRVSLEIIHLTFSFAAQTHESIIDKWLSSSDHSIKWYFSLTSDEGSICWKWLPFPNQPLGNVASTHCSWEFSKQSDRRQNYLIFCFDGGRIKNSGIDFCGGVRLIDLKLYSMHR